MHFKEHTDNPLCSFVLIKQNQESGNGIACIKERRTDWSNSRTIGIKIKKRVLSNCMYCA